MYAGHPWSARVRMCVPLVGLLAVAGCSDTAGGPSAAAGGPASTATSNPFLSLSTEAEQAGADPTQLEMLSDGRVDYSEYETAMNRAFDCMRAAGTTVNVAGTMMQNGVTVFDVTFSAPGATGTEASGPSDACFEKYASYVDTAWQSLSPESVAYSERRHVALKPLLQDCLSRHGVDWSDDQTWLELSDHAIDQRASDPYNCYAEIGYSGWQG